jgi:hypothetical protein
MKMAIIILFSLNIWRARKGVKISKIISGFILSYNKIKGGDKMKSIPTKVPAFRKL